MDFRALAGQPAQPVRLRGQGHGGQDALREGHVRFGVDAEGGQVGGADQGGGAVALAVGHAAGEAGRPLGGAAFPGQQGPRGHAELLHGAAGAGADEGELAAPLAHGLGDDRRLLGVQRRGLGAVVAVHLHDDHLVRQQFLDHPARTSLGRMRRRRPGGSGRLRHSRG